MVNQSLQVSGFVLLGENNPTYKVSWTPNVDSVLIGPLCEWMSLFSSNVRLQHPGQN